MRPPNTTALIRRLNRDARAVAEALHARDGQIAQLKERIVDLEAALALAQLQVESSAMLLPDEEES